jgi:plastocyanin
MGGKAFAHAFTVAGRCQYVCTLHETMAMIATLTAN